MGRKCAVENCTNNCGRDISKSYYSFPKDSEICRAWVMFCGSKELEQDFFTEGPTAMQKKRICSDHFAPESFRNVFLKDKGLMPGSIPIYPAHRRKEVVGEFVIYHLD